MRINKYICESGLCSRKAADTLVKKGVVFIDGKRAIPGDKVSVGGKVTVNGLTIEPLATDKVIFIVLNKPVGVVSTAAKTDKRNIVDFVGHGSRIYPVGRLDKDSEGLIFLTNRCDLVDKILKSGNQHEKEYEVTVNKEVTDEFIDGLSRGVPILGVVTKNCKVVKESRYVFRITLVQGLNRQIRRMCKHYNYSVEKLERVRIMHISMDGLSAGQWRNLDNEELSKLLYLLQQPTPDNSPPDLAATITFVPAAFTIPDELRTGKFQFEILGPSVAQMDYQAVMSSRKRLRSVFRENGEWPRDSLTLESNTVDLIRHESEFMERKAFAYCVLTPDRSRYIGCVYFVATTASAYDSKVYLWVADSELGLDHCLFVVVKQWLRDAWPFANTAFPGRDISWSDWSDISS